MRAHSLALVLCLASHGAACGTDSKAKAYVELSDSQKAREALDAQDFPRAIELYQKIIASNPADYESYRFLAAAQAGAGGFDIVDAVQGMIDEAGSSLMDTLGQLVPKNPRDEDIAALKAACDTMLRLPADQRDPLNTAVPSASSAAQQLQFYQAAYSIIYINKFSDVGTDGSLDPSKLESMTDEDVDAILDNFESIVAESSDGAVSEGVSAILEQLDSMPGNTRRDKLIAYMNSQNS